MEWSGVVLHCSMEGQGVVVHLMKIHYCFIKKKRFVGFFMFLNESFLCLSRLQLF